MFNKIQFQTIACLIIITGIFMTNHKALAQETAADQRLNEIRSLIQENKKDSALIKIDEMLKEDTENEDFLKMRIAVSAMYFDDCARVIQDLTMLEKVSDEPLEFIAGIAAIYIQREKDEAAVQVLKVFIPKYPESEVLLIMRGNLSQLAEDNKSAIQDYLKALQIHPDDEKAINMLARAYFGDMQIKKSFDLLDHLLDLNPDSKETEELRQYLTSGISWTTDQLIEVLHLQGLSFDSRKEGDIFTCYTNQEAENKSELIKVTRYEFSFIASEEADSLNVDHDEMDKPIFMPQPFSWGNFIFEQECGENENCIQLWESVQLTLVKLQEAGLTDNESNE